MHVRNMAMDGTEQGKVTEPNTQPARHTTLARTLAQIATGRQQGFMTIDQEHRTLALLGSEVLPRSKPWTPARLSDTLHCNR